MNPSGRELAGDGHRCPVRGIHCFCRGNWEGIEAAEKGEVFDWCGTYAEMLAAGWSRHTLANNGFNMNLVSNMADISPFSFFSLKTITRSIAITSWTRVYIRLKQNGSHSKTRGHITEKIL